MAPSFAEGYNKRATVYYLLQAWNLFSDATQHNAEYGTSVILQMDGSFVNKEKCLILQCIGARRLL
jgi:hypothetical protein